MTVKLPRGIRQAHPASPAGKEEFLGAVSYLGVILFGPVVPLAIYLTCLHGSPFVRRHATQALNIALTWLLYAISGAIVGALLAFDNITAALGVMVPLAVAGWGVMLAQLIPSAVTARRGGFRQVPPWACSPLVKLLVCHVRSRITASASRRPCRVSTSLPSAKAEGSAR